MNRSWLRLALIFLVAVILAQPVLAQDAVEAGTWKLIRNSSDPEVFQNYLEEFPNGAHVADARGKLAALTDQGGAMNNGAPAAPATPPAKKPGAAKLTGDKARPPVLPAKSVSGGVGIVGSWQILARCPNSSRTVGTFTITSADASGIVGRLDASKGYSGKFHGGSYDGHRATYYFDFVDAFDGNQQMLWTAEVGTGGRTMTGTSGPCTFSATRL